MTIPVRAETPLLPDRFARWFASRGWTPRAHQLELLAKARAGRSVLLIAPTGGGKTLAGFLPTLVELARPRRLLGPPSPLAGEGGSERSEEPGEGPAFVTPKRPLTRLAAKAARHPLPQGERVMEPAAPPIAPNLISTGRGIRREGGLHTLYISPLKALAVDIARNLEAPVAEMKLPIRVETRTGDTPASKRQRQRRDPPQI